MPPLPTIGGSNPPRVELSGNGIETCVTGRLDVPNDRQHVGRKLSRLPISAFGRNPDIERPRPTPRELRWTSRLGWIIMSIDG
jgi:hypothetical protein